MDDPKLNLPEVPRKPGPEHHDRKGRFVDGNPGNKDAPGRPPGRPNFWNELRLAVKRYRSPGGEKFFDAIVDRAMVCPRLAEKLVDKLFEDATVPKGIDLTMIQGAGQIEDVVKDLARQREERAKAAGRLPMADEEEEP